MLGHSLYEACAKATAITDIRAVSVFYPSIRLSVASSCLYHAHAIPRSSSFRVVFVITEKKKCAIFNVYKKIAIWQKP